MPFFIESYYKNKKTSAATFNGINFIALEKWELNPSDMAEDALRKIFILARLDKVKALNNGLVAGIPPDHVTEGGWTLLTYAAFHGATKVVKHLLADGEFEPNFDPRFAGRAKRSAYNTLHAACAGGQIELVNYLLENHSDLLNIDMPDELLGQSPLQIAMLHNRLPLVMDITKNRLPNLKHVDFRGRTLLCTVLGTFMREGIKEDIVDKDRLPELENLCLDLLEMENAFKKSTSESVSAITLIFKSDLMSNASEDDKVNYPTPFVALFKIAKLCPRVGEKLNKQAIKLRDEGVLPATEEGGRVLAFISLYKEVMDQVAIESKPQLTAHLIEAAKR